MTSLAAVRDGLAARLSTIPGLRVYSYLPDDAGYPAAVIFPPVNADYTDALGGTGSTTYSFVVMLFVPANIDRNQLDLYALVDSAGSSSVYATIEADRTLGLDGVDCRVDAATDPLSRGQMASTQVFQRAVTVQAIVS